MPSASVSDSRAEDLTGPSQRCRDGVGGHAKLSGDHVQRRSCAVCSDDAADTILRYSTLPPNDSAAVQSPTDGVSMDLEAGCQVLHRRAAVVELNELIDLVIS